MDVATIVEDAQRNGVKFEINGDTVRARVAEHKKHLVDELRPYREQIRDYFCRPRKANFAVSGDNVGSVDVDRGTPFPIYVLPEAVGKYVAEAANAIGCDPSFIGLPLLVIISRAIGSTRVIRLKDTWAEYPILWGAMIGKSGTHKTPALNAATKFLSKKQADAIKSHAEKVVGYEGDVSEFERDIAAWRKSKNAGPPPTKPAEPVCKRYLTSDCTIEALASLLSAQYDGIVVCRDELAGWLNGIAEYKGGKGSDCGHWLACWSGQPMLVDRKTGSVKRIYVERASVSLIGGIQPEILRSALGREHMQDGLCARLLLVMPEAKPVVWSEDTVAPLTEQAVSEVLDQLLTIEPLINDEEEPTPLPLEMSPEAKALWIEYFNRHRAEIADLDNDLAAAWSKLEAYTARFALIFQLCSWASGTAGCDEIDEQSMQSAIILSDWFGTEAKRVYGLFIETDEQREQRELVELIQRKGGRLSARELQQASRRFKKSIEAESALADLVRAGFGSWDVVTTGRRQRTDFVLSTPSTPTVSPVFAVSSNNVDGTGSEEMQ